MSKSMNEVRDVTAPVLRKLIHTLMLALLMTASVLTNVGMAHAAPTGPNDGVTGKVVDKSGEALPGVSVVVKGTQIGTATDADGNFSLPEAPRTGTLQFSFIGMKSQEIGINNRSSLQIVMEDEAVTLNEVVAIGYGVQQKKLLTGATVQVTGDNLQKLSTVNVFNAMQGQTPGVSITQNSGQPGSGYNVYIRGMGTIGNWAPLYVIDGVAGGDITKLNASDIESMDVLKDAASTAIYGARAANGVILVTTKQGKEGKMQVSYDGSYGWQNAYRMPSMLNAQQYMQIQNEINFNEGQAPVNWQSVLSGPYGNSGGSYYDAIQNGTWNGTNWLDAVRVKNAPVQNHAFNMVGGNDISKYSMGVSYTSQEGIFGAPAASDYKRTTARLNSDHVILKGKGFDIIKIGETLNYAYATNSGIAQGNMYWNDISNLMRAMPIMPIYGPSGNYFNFADMSTMGLSSYQSGMANPIATMLYNRGYNTNKSYNLNMSGNLQIQPIKNLIFKSQIAYSMWANSYRSFVPTYDALSSTAANAISHVQQTSDIGWSYDWSNTLNYLFKFDEHHFDVLAGEEVSHNNMGERIDVTNGPLLFTDYSHAYLSNAPGFLAGTTQINGSPLLDNATDANLIEGGITSFFGRINYDWNETYLLSLILRTDGSSNFAKGHRWGTFPAVSAGWVMSNEKFMESATSWLNFLKLRASWGQNGNQNIPNFKYLAQITMGSGTANGSNYSFGNNKDAPQTGGFPSNLANPDITWEKSDQVDAGLDARFLRSRLGATLDWYLKRTLGWLIQAPVLGSYGVGSNGAPWINGGDIQNRGIEVALNWNDHVGKDFTYGVNWNLSYNANRVTRIANTEGIVHGNTNVLSQSTGEFYRAQVGYPVGYFWGYKTAGVFQNQADIDAWRAAGNGFIQSNPQPGDLKFVDLNHDGVINDEDKTMIGDPNPKYHMGFSFNFGYKGFDLTMATYGAFAFQIAQSYRSFADSPAQNFTTDVFNRWYGEGTSNTMPRLTLGNNANYINISDIYMHNGSYLRCQNLTLGYDLKKLCPKMPLAEARLFVTAENLFTITSYSGMDPEIGSAIGTNTGDQPWATNIDIGFYPQPRTYLVGINLKF